MEYPLHIPGLMHMAFLQNWELDGSDAIRSKPYFPADLHHLLENRIFPQFA